MILSTLDNFIPAQFKKNIRYIIVLGGLRLAVAEPQRGEGGGGGIRTHVSLRSRAFQARGMNRYPTPPGPFLFYHF